jgi:hypothetical protein
MIPGTPERRSFDYVRHGTTDLFAPLNTATGKVIGNWLICVQDGSRSGLSVWQLMPCSSGTCCWCCCR